MCGTCQILGERYNTTICQKKKPLKKTYFSGKASFPQPALELDVMNFASIALFDYILLAVLIFFVVHGLWVGVLRQLPFVIALIGSYWAAGQYAGELMPHVGQLTEDPKLVFGGGFLVLLIVSTLLFKLVGKLLGKVIQVKRGGWINRFFFGASLGLAKAAVLVVLAIMFLAATLSPPEHSFRDSMTAPYLEQGTDIARSLIRDAKIRKDLKPRQAPVQEQKKEAATAKQAATEREVVAPPPAEPPQPRPSNNVDDPASSTEILTD
ncbi:MAG: CvpA family protein [Candidatus Electrothrix sp. ATG2]|nr:CvpA family protein [Candidatus Electrothrix sp. ATG2]